MNRYVWSACAGLFAALAYAMLHLYRQDGEVSTSPFLNVCLSVVTIVITLPTALDVARAEPANLGVLEREKGSLIVALVLVVGFLMLNVGIEFSKVWGDEPQKSRLDCECAQLPTPTPSGHGNSLSPPS